MPKIDPPIAHPDGPASSRAEADHEGSEQIDWQQLSHELRTPLNAILGNVELLLDGSAGPLSAQARTCVGEVQVAGHQLLRQVRMLLAWSELCACAPKLTRRPVDLIALVREALLECGNPAQIEPQDASFPICGDPRWLQTLLAEIATLGGAPGAAPTVRFARSAGRGTLDFAWPGFCAARTASLHVALIEAIARAQGVAVVRNSGGLALHWPLEQLDGPEAARGAPGPDPADRRDAGPAPDTARRCAG